MKNNNVDFSADLLDRSSPIEMSFPRNLEEATARQSGGPKVGVSVEDTVFALAHMQDIEAQHDRIINQIGIVPGAVSSGRLAKILDRELKGQVVEEPDLKAINWLADKVEESFSTPGKLKNYFRRLEDSIFNRRVKKEAEPDPVAEKISSKLLGSISMDLNEVEAIAVKSIKRGHVNIESVPTLVAIAQNSDQFGVATMMSVAHDVKNYPLIKALYPVYKAKKTQLPAGEKIQVRLKA
ncbi:MAG: hypothetical protein KGH71_03670 [Candidatus Micrarchaeota archaeon]|nr:hypothetical protein [Candidatus Micrarchaeota archaeon]